MSASQIRMTYLGSCTVAGKLILCTSMSASLDQRVLFFDHVLGLQDRITSGGSVTKGPSNSDSLSNVQKKVYRYSPAIAKASISAPIPSDVFQTILDKAIHGGDLEVIMVFAKNSAPKVRISKAKIASLSLDLKAGDVAQFSMEVAGAEYESSTGASSEVPCAKLVTWDRCTVAATPISDNISSFTLNINNPIVPIYTSKWTTDSASNGMMPQKIRIGVQEVTGTIGVYGQPQIVVPSVGTVEFSLNGAGKKINAEFVQPKDDGSGGPYIRTVTFNGVSDGSVWA